MEFVEHFDNAVKFIKNYQLLIDSHLVDFYTEDLWQKCIPVKFNFRDLESANDNSIEFKEFIRCTESLSLKRFIGVKAIEHLNENNKKDLAEGFEKSKLDFMNEKKSHEVQGFFQVVSRIVAPDNSIILDVGAGKGYLSTHLSQKLGVEVLAVDSSKTCHDGALKREKLMHKKKTSSESLVSHVVQEINENVNLIKLIQDNSLNYHPNKRISLIGLHTCGSLAHSLIKAFVRTKEISTLCIVPCCYHLTDESLSGRYQFTKNSRMLAQQSVERSSNKKETLPISLFYRAVLQVILKKAGIHNARVGRGLCATDFVSYVNAAFEKLEISEDKKPHTKEIVETYNNYLKEKWKMDIFQVFRIYLGSILEGLLVLDRIIYLQTSCNDIQVDLVRMFDPTISPRCFAIVARR